MNYYHTKSTEILKTKKFEFISNITVKDSLVENANLEIFEMKIIDIDVNHKKSHENYWCRVALIFFVPVFARLS